MALIKCHECKGNVSDHASTCPHCGAPVIATIKRRQKAMLVDLGLRVMLAVILGVFVWFTMHHLFNKLWAPLKGTQQSQTH